MAPWKPLRKKTQPPLTVSLYQLGLFPLVNALVYVNIDQGIHKGKKVQTDKAKPSEVAGSFYAMVFMVPSVWLSIDFC